VNISLTVLGLILAVVSILAIFRVNHFPSTVSY